MRRSARWFLLISAWAVSWGCSAFQSNEPLPSSVTEVPDEYRVGPPDVLGIGIWKQPELSLPSATVRPDGKISMPLLGDIEVDGLTTREIKEVITERIKEYVSDPEVTVVILQVNNPIVFILGEVNRPGPIPLRQNTTILQAIAIAGGFTSFADKDDIYVLRREGEKDYRFRFNYEKVVKGKGNERNIFVKSGDIIVVED